MIIQDNYATDIKISYIGGGSRGWAWSFINDLANASRLSGQLYLYDIDFEAAKRNETIGNSIARQHSQAGNFTYKAVEQLSDALKDINLFPMYDAFCHSENMTNVDRSNLNWMNRYFDSMNLVKMDLYKRYGVIAAATTSTGETTETRWYDDPAWGGLG